MPRSIEGRRLGSKGTERLARYASDWTVLLDETGRILHELGSRDTIFGGDGATSSIGRRIAAFVHPEDLTLAVDRMADSLSAIGSEVRFQIRAGLPELGYRSVYVAAINRFDDPILNGLIVAVSSKEDPIFGVS